MVMPIDDKEYIAELEDERNGWQRDTIALREENARLRAALKWEAFEDCACHCCTQKIQRAKVALGMEEQIDAALAPEVK